MVNYATILFCMKKNVGLLFCIFLLTTSKYTHAQDTFSTHSKVFKIAVFAPLYLDSAFSNGQLNSGNSLPKFIMPSVEFVQGARIALDTINLNGKSAEAYIYDSKSYLQPIPWLIKYKKLDDVNLIIGAVKEPDFHQLADFAREKNIPFVSAIYPNDGGIKADPNLFIVNSTLKSHCEGIFSYLLQKYGTDKIYLVKRRGDDRIENYFRNLNYTEGKPLLNIKTIMVDSTISTYSLSNRVDTTKPIVIIGASLDEDFAKNLADACLPIQKTHQLVLIGMPNWDGFKSLYNKDAYPDFPILFTTPHFESKETPLDSILIKKYFQLYRAKPSDMAYKGFGITWYFTNLLLNFPNDFTAHINDSELAPFHSFNFRPVYKENNEKEPDYYENKHLFIIEIFNGEIVREW